MSKDNRTLQRRHLMYYLEVHDDTGGGLMGYLLDISSSGIKLMSRDPIEPGESFRMRLVLPEELLEERQMYFTAICKWCGPDVNPDFFDIGFKVTEMPAEFNRVVNKLVARVGFAE